MAVEVTNVKLDKEKIMRRMKDARIAQNLSYRELSDKTGISRAQLCVMETRFSDGTSLLHLLSVSKALHIDFLYLCGLKDEY